MSFKPYTVRFVPTELVEDLLFAYRMTAVGHPVGQGCPKGVDPFGRYGRILRAVHSFETSHPGVRGAYKDLDGLIGQECGRILPPSNEEDDPKVQRA